MPELRILTPAAQSFNAGTVAKPQRQTRKNRMKSLADPSVLAAKVALFGNQGTGKTYTIVALLKMGFKVVVLSTDLGGNGLLTIRLALKQEGLLHLLDNCRFIQLKGFDDVNDFLDDPKAFAEDFYTWSPDFLFWDGFSNFQGNDLKEYVGAGAEAMAGKKADDMADIRVQGFRFEIKDYEPLNNATLRLLDKFLGLNNKETGQIIHKIVTMMESIRSKPKSSDNPTAGAQYVDEKKPLLSGQSGILSGAAFDLIIRCSVETGRDDSADSGEARKYWYITEGNQNVAAKKRGFKLPAKMEADFSTLWKDVAAQAGFEDRQFSDEVKETGNNG